MRKELAPIIHREVYTDLIEGPLRSYLWETIFGPLVELLHDNGVQTSAKDQAIGRTPEFTEFKNGRPWTIFTPALRSLRVKRQDLPQIHQDDRDGLLEWLDHRGIGHEQGTILPHDLRPTQEGYWPEKVDAALAHTGEDRAILVSSDWFILDGHHQWAAALTRPEQPVPVIVFDALIRPLLAAARAWPRATFKNAQDQTVEQALADGRLWYADGKFSGQFNAALSRQLRELGAIWDGTAKTFSLPIDQLPMELRVAIAEIEERSSDLHKKMLWLLAAMTAGILLSKTGISYRKAARSISNDLRRQFDRTVPPELHVADQENPEQVASILEKNLDFYIKKFSVKQIRDLMELVGLNEQNGARADQLGRIIEARWGISKRKVRFLADQETSLLVAEYRKQKYQRIGSTHYVWRTQRDNRVRPTPDFPGTNNHRMLESKIFGWDFPPVVDYGTGRRCHPGQDFGCRCYCLPIIDLPDKSIIPQQLRNPWPGENIKYEHLVLNK